MQTLLESCLANALVATALALVAAGVRPFCRKPALLHFLWLLVLLKLITPPIVTIPLTIPALFEPAPTEVAGPRFGEGPLERQGLEIAIAAANQEPPAEREADEEDLAAFLGTEASTESLPLLANAVEEPGRAAAWFRFDKASWLTGFAACWLAGSFLLFGVTGFRMGRFHSLLRAGWPAPGPLQEQARLIAERLGLARCPTVWLVPGRISPLLWPLGKGARLVLPAGLLERLSPAQQDTLLAHELAHARRRDHWVRWLELVVIGLYWWFPVAWWARQQLQQAEEQCCDAWVVWTIPSAAKAYAKALLQTVEFLDARPALPPSASGIGHVYFLKGD